MIRFDSFIRFFPFTHSIKQSIFNLSIQYLFYLFQTVAVLSANAYSGLITKSNVRLHANALVVVPFFKLQINKQYSNHLCILNTVHSTNGGELRHRGAD